MLACGGPPPESAERIVRVSAGHDLTCLDALTGSSAQAAELVYLAAEEVAVVEDIDDTHVALVPRPAAGLSARELCDQLHIEDSIRNTAEPARCVVAFRSPESKRRTKPLLRLELGPFQSERVVPKDESLDARDLCTGVEPGDGRPSPLLDRIELRRRKEGQQGSRSPVPAAVSRIHIIRVRLKDQWRSLFAREVDVIPSTPMMYHHWFTEMESIETVMLPTTSYLALYFNTSAAPWSDVDTRRALARSLDLEAIAAVACRDPGCRSPAPTEPELRGTIQPPRVATRLPREITLDVLESDSTGVAAAKVISHQLRRQGLEVRIIQHPVTAMNKVWSTGSFGMLLAPLSIPAVGGQDFLTRLQFMAKYRNDELSAATRRGDHGRVAAILAEDVPALPLFRYLQFAAIDTGLCGGKPTSQTSWRWLADLHPCKDGEAR